MSNKTIIARNTVLTVLVATVAATGCVTTGTNAPASQNASADDGGCNTLLLGGVGALAGALLAKGNNRVRGAALGAGAGALACMAWNYHTKQTKTAEQVQRDYRTAHGSLPRESRITTYNVNFAPTSRIAAGDATGLRSTIEVVQGTAAPSPIVEQEMVITKPDGSELRARKRANEGYGAGQFEGNFDVRMPRGVPQGDYPVRTAIYLDGQRVASRDMTLQVVAARNGDNQVALLAN